MAAPDAEQKKIVSIVRRLEEDSRIRKAIKHPPYILISALVCVLLPTLIASIFYLFIASDRYVSEVRFAVRSNESQTADALGLMTGLPSSQIVSDSYIVADYIESRDMIKVLEGRLPLREMYSTDQADYFNRLPKDASLEELIAYWQDQVDVYYDSTKNTISLEVQAFSPEDAEMLAKESLDIVRQLVNDLSYRARTDAVKFAASEVARAELRVRDAGQQILDFRVAHNEVNPAESAEATLGIAADLAGEKSKLSSQLASVSAFLADDAPSVQMLKSRIAALEKEIANIQSRVSTGGSASNSEGTEGAGSGAIASLIGEYQDLMLNQQFAEKAYTAAMASLERARADADRTQSYLAIYTVPSLAEDAKYPERGLGILIVFLLSCIAWAIGALAFLTVRDHLA